ncbi:MAG TPA: ferrous iron transport protein B, partial [Gemmatimonadaceae bacterium]|nr:ferrous iron transport protein B [Gemmatimonadaceae bacterium]
MTGLASGAPPAGAPAVPAPGARTPLRVALVGNPNTGKSTLFNALTGMRQKVGNFPGVTVERLEGSYREEDGRRVTVLDLPGSYSLSPHAPDEAIALDVLLGRAQGVPAADVIVVVVDAQNLDRNLFLASQLLELGVPMVIALNQMDAAAEMGIRIDVPELIHELGVAIIPTVATRGEGIDALRRAVSRAPDFPRPARRFTLEPAVAECIAPLERALEVAGLSPAAAALEALRLLAHVNPEDPHRYGAAVERALQESRAALAARGVNAHALEAERRYHWITGVMQRTVQRPPPGGRTWSDRVDRVLLNRVGGPLIFLGLMAVVFQSIFTWAQPVMTRIGAFFDWLGVAVGSHLPAGDLRSLVQDGVIGGVGSVLTFLPQIAILFLCIGILEDSGYMARAAFLMDRYMRRVGLHGRSFIPLLSGYACAVPAIMSTRSIEEPKDRIATIMVVPLMSCSARLPVYTLLIAA